MLAIKPEYLEAYEREFADAPRIKEYLIATAMANGQCNNIYEVMRQFNLTWNEAVIILDSLPFNVVLNKVIKAKKVLGKVELLNRLVKSINEGEPDETIDAIKTLDYLAAQWDLKPNMTKKQRSRPNRQVANTVVKQLSSLRNEEESCEAIIVDGVIESDEPIEFVEVDD